MRSPLSDRSLAPFAGGPVLGAAAANLLVLLLFAGRYGYHRDELYFLSSAKRLAWGFVDQPPITPAIARLSEAIAPGFLVALRVWPALFTAASIVLAALCARELGSPPCSSSSVCCAPATCACGSRSARCSASA